MKNLLCSFLFVVSVSIARCQIPATGNVLWLKADAGVYNDNGTTPASVGNLVQFWADQSGNGNDFTQDTSGYRPQLVAQANILCSRPVLRFTVTRRTFLRSDMRLDGPKSIFIVFIVPPFLSAAETLLSLKGNSDQFTELVATDFSGYKPVTLISDLPSSTAGTYMQNSVGINATFSSQGNLLCMIYDGGPITNSASYDVHFDNVITPPSGGGLLGRYPYDSTTIGARAPYQNINFFTGDIAEIIVYDRVLSLAETDQVQGYLITKFGFFGTCVALPLTFLDFTANVNNNTVHVDWRVSDENSVQEYVVEHSADVAAWDSVGVKRTSPLHINISEYGFIHSRPVTGNNYYRLRIRTIDGRSKYSEVRKVIFMGTQPGQAWIFPNPFKDHINVNTEANEWLDITIVNDDGKLVKALHVFSHSPIELGDLPGGMYIITISGKKTRITRKLLKL